jgi:mono/diheme cytochrome c family protein
MVTSRTIPRWLFPLLALALACDKNTESNEGKAEPAAVVEEPSESASLKLDAGAKPAEEVAEETDAAAEEPAEPDDDDDDDAAADDDDDDDDDDAGAASAKGSTAKPAEAKAPKKADARADPKKADPPKGKTPDAGGLTLADGKQIYLKRCKNCHGTGGAADTAQGKKHDIPDWTVAGWKAKWPLSKVRDITANGKAGTKMRAFKDRLSDEELDIVSKYAHSLGK